MKEKRVVYDPYMTARSMLEGLEAGEFSASFLLERAVERHLALKASINAVVVTDLERARKDAAAIDAARARGEKLGPLAGIPMTVKECFDMEGHPATAGAPYLLAREADCADAAMVAALRKAGAVVWGKTNVPLMLADAQSFNAIWGTSNNPYDPSRTPGGSSGGAAAALASGITPLELGSDIGGSLRNPASFCGVASLKPTLGALSQRGHVPGGYDGVDLNVVGPMARTVGDLRLLWGALSGRATPARKAGSSRGLRVALWAEEGGWPLSKEAAAAVRAAARALEEDGAIVVEAKPAIDMDAMVDCYLRLLCGILALGLPGAARRLLALGRGPTFLAKSLQAELFTRARYANYLASSRRAIARAGALRDGMKAAAADFFRDNDAMLMPVAPTAAFPHAQGKDSFGRPYFVDGRKVPYNSWLRWISFATVLHSPAAVVRAGTGEGGLPLGVQIVGPLGSEAKLLDVAERIEVKLGGFRPPPLE